MGCETVLQFCRGSHLLRPVESDSDDEPARYAPMAREMTKKRIGGPSSSGMEKDSNLKHTMDSAARL